MCKSDEEINSHFFLRCPSSAQVLKEVEDSLGLQKLWKKDTVQECFKERFEKRELKKFRVVPFLVIW